MILKLKEKKLSENEDIASEFAYWIENGAFRPGDDCVYVEGYSAERLSNLSPYLDGEGAFMMLIDLRERPSETKRKIEAGFKLK